MKLPYQPLFSSKGRATPLALPFSRGLGVAWFLQIFSVIVHRYWRSAVSHWYLQRIYIWKKVLMNWD